MFLEFKKIPAELVELLHLLSVMLWKSAVAFYFVAIISCLDKGLGKLLAVCLSYPTPVFVNTILLEHSHTQSCTYCLQPFSL